MEQAQVLWLARMALVSGGGWLSGRGIGDAALWEAVTGAGLAVIGAIWSWRARRALEAAPAVRR